MAFTLHALDTPDRADAAPGALAPLLPDGAEPTAEDPSPIRVLIAEGQGLVRAAFHLLLEHREDVRVVAEAATGEEALSTARHTRPDVVLMDIALPGLGGLETTRRILDEMTSGELRVVMLMTDESDEAVFGALRAGATGLLLKDARPDDLVNAVRVVAAGEALLGPTLARRLVGDFLSRPERLRSTPEQFEELTTREREVVSLVAFGLSNDEIAERLVVTRATAKTHVSRALCKLHARDRTQLVVMAYETGLVRPGPGWNTGPQHRALSPSPSAATTSAFSAAPAPRTAALRSVAA